MVGTMFLDFGMLLTILSGIEIDRMSGEAVGTEQ